MGRALSALIGKEPLYSLVEEGADVVLDFSSPEGTKSAIALGKPLVCGTTALPQGVWSSLLALSKEQPVLYSPNYSLGIAACLSICLPLKKILGPHAQISIQEIHHKEKKDAPSGTALKLAELLAVPKERISSLRAEGAIGVHEIQFSLPGEELSIRHHALSREAFAKGALQAAQFIQNQTPGLYTLQDLFD